MKTISMIYSQDKFINECVALIKPQTELENKRLYTLIDTYLDNCKGFDIAMPKEFIANSLKGKIYYKEQELENLAKSKDIDLSKCEIGEDTFDENFRLLKDEWGFFGYYFDC